MEHRVKITFLKMLKKFGKDLHGYLMELYHEHGDIFVLEPSFMKSRIHVFFNPIHLKYILVDEHTSYVRPAFASDILDDVWGKEGFFTTLNEDIWRKHRSILNPLFDEGNIKKMTSNMIETTTKCLDSWEEFRLEQKPVSIHRVLPFLAFDNLINTLFSKVKINAPHVARMIGQLFSEVAFATTSQVKFFGNFSHYFFYFQRQKLKKNFAIAADEIIDYCLSDKADKDNLVRVLAESYRNENKQISDEELKLKIRPNLLIIFATGYDTLANAVISALVSLSLSPIHAKKIHQEVKHLLGNRLPTYEDISKLVYTRSVVQEAIRLNPSVDVFFRTALHDDQIGQHKIKKGDTILISPFHMHRLPKYWPNAQGFDPDRFLKPLDEQYKHIYIPFGIGPKKCIGQYLSLAQATLILAMISQRYQLSLTLNSKTEREGAVAPSFKNVMMTVHNAEEMFV